MSKELALSISSLAQEDRQLLSMPITTLANKAGLCANDVYKVLLPALANETDLGEGLRFAETALKYASIVDQNRLRAEIGEEFVLSLELVIDFVREGLDASDKFLKRKAIALHGALIDSHAEKRRFVETVMVEDKLKEIAASKQAREALLKEVSVIDCEVINGEAIHSST